MPDFDKVVSLIEIEVDNSASIKAVEDFTDKIINQQKAIKANNETIKALNKSNSDLEKQVKAGSITEAEASAEIEENTKQAKNLEKQNYSLRDGLKDLNKERASAVTASKLESNSLDALRKSVAAQKKELNGLNTSTELGKKRFDELTASLKTNNDRIVELDQDAGDFKTTIGRYSEEMMGAMGASGGFGSSLKTLFTMILTNPVGLIVAALVSLVAVFKQTQTGAELFRKAGAAFNVIVGIMKDYVEALGIALIDAFENPKQAILDLKKTLVDNVVKYFTEFIPNAIKKTIDGFKLLWDAMLTLDFDKAVEGSRQLVDGITDLMPATALLKTGIAAAIPFIQDLGNKISEATSRAYALEQQLIANEKATADQAVAVAKSIQEQKALNRIIEDQTAAYADRIAAAEKFAAVEAAQVSQSIALAQERVNILKAQNDLTNSTEEDIQRVRDAEIELANLQAASDERLLTNSNKLFGIRQQQRTEHEKNELALNTKLLALAEARRSAANEFALKETEDIKSNFELRRAIAQENFDLERERLAIEREIAFEDESLSEEERAIKIAENDLNRETLRQTHANTMVLIASQQAEEEKRIEEEKEEFIRKLVEKGKGAVDDIVKIANNLVERRYRERFRELKKMHEEGAISDEQFAKMSKRLEQQKALDAWEIEKKTFLVKKIGAIAQTGIDTARGISMAFGTFPFPVAAGFASAVGALGAVQLAAILSEPPPPAPEFKQGGDVFGVIAGGNLHSNGGTTYTGEDGNRFNVERDEGIFVTKREATNPAIKLLDEASISKGGRSMFSNSVRFAENGGSINMGSNDDNARRVFMEMISAMPRPVVDVKSIMGAWNAENEAQEIGII